MSAGRWCDSPPPWPLTVIFKKHTTSHFYCCHIPTMRGQLPLVLLWCLCDFDIYFCAGDRCLLHHWIYRYIIIYHYHLAVPWLCLCQDSASKCLICPYFTSSKWVVLPHHISSTAAFLSFFNLLFCIKAEHHVVVVDVWGCKSNTSLELSQVGLLDLSVVLQKVLWCCSSPDI